MLPDGRLIIRKSKLSNAECERASNLPKSWWFKELQGLLTPWVERRQEYVDEIQHRPGKHYSSEGKTYIVGGIMAEERVTSRLHWGKQQNNVKDLWSHQRMQCGFSPRSGSWYWPSYRCVSREWRKPTNEELHPWVEKQRKSGQSGNL